MANQRWEGPNGTPEVPYLPPFLPGLCLGAPTDRGGAAAAEAASQRSSLHALTCFASALLPLPTSPLQSKHESPATVGNGTGKLGSLISTRPPHPLLSRRPRRKLARDPLVGGAVKGAGNGCPGTREGFAQTLACPSQRSQRPLVLSPLLSPPPPGSCWRALTPTSPTGSGPLRGQAGSMAPCTFL